MQQYLPFTVLKHYLPRRMIINDMKDIVATVLTVYGIETRIHFNWAPFSTVATVLTVYGIETYILHSSQMHCCELQQYLPFTVLKHWILFNNATN